MSRGEATTRWLLIRVAALLLPTLLVACNNGPDSSSSSSTPASSTTPSSSSTSPSSSAPPSSSPSPSSTSPTSPATNRCRTSDLDGSIGTVSAASGKRRVDIVLTNVSDKPCTLEGYPRVQPANSSGTMIEYPTRQSLNPGRTLPADLVVHPVTLQPSMSAYAIVFYNGAWITEADKKSCVKFTDLAITPPDEDAHLLIPNADEACIDPLEIGPLDDHPP